MHGQPSWSTPFFEVFERPTTQSPSSASSASLITLGSSHARETKDRWIFRSIEKQGVRVYAYALFNGFGQSNNTTLLDLVVQTLVPQIIYSTELERIVVEFKRTREIGKDAKMTSIDQQALLRGAFINTDLDVYEKLKAKMEKKARHVSTSRSGDDDVSVVSGDSFGSLRLSDNTFSDGCTAILCLIIEDLLYVANCNSCQTTGWYVRELGHFNFFRLAEPPETFLFQVSETHEDPEKMKSMNTIPFRCFGVYSEKYDSNTLQTTEPFIPMQSIQLDKTLRFILLASPNLMKIAFLCNPNSLSSATTHLCSMYLDEQKRLRNISASLQSVMEKLQEKYNRTAPTGQSVNLLSMAYIELENDLNADEFQRQTSSEDASNDQRSSWDTAERVRSEVDWSEFDTSELRDEVIAKIESLKQFHQERKKLTSIEETDDHYEHQLHF
ncbi:hypothetical protein M3Y94_00957200 [Aphelenchoides besseyi]|nr:hypothetical protein M3Y94_00957200 [Aphelenchoides besseyi]